MIEKTIDITLPFLWGDEHFIKETWGNINYIVGSNGTGKSLLAVQLKNQLTALGFTPRYLSAERLTGFEKSSANQHQNVSFAQGFNLSSLTTYKDHAENTGLSSSGFIILKERLDIRIRIEALLSDIFGKNIRLAEEGGFLKPRIQNIESGNEYGLRESECHGLKELITLLTFLYDPSKNCIIFDEPELHLHPQFQSFFLEEIRKVSGNPLEDPTKKMIFIITHSPYFIDIKTIEDLKNIIVCGSGKAPTHIAELDEDDTYILNKFIPRFNTHHKQFFFSPNPVFVEGYTDQQIITILFEKMGINIGASGSCIIDVGGKDELGVFYKLCKALKIECRILADLDALFRGKLREVVCDDEKPNTYIQSNGIGTDISSEIGDLSTKLSSLIENIVNTEFEDSDLSELKEKILSFNNEKIHKKRVSMLLGIINISEKIKDILTGNDLANFNLIIGKLNQIIEAFKTTNTFILEKGEIEHYYSQNVDTYLNNNNKDTTFHAERDFLLEAEGSEIEELYSELIPILREAVPLVDMELRKHIKFEVFSWIQKVQVGINKKEITNDSDLMRNAKINYTLYSQILNLESLIVNEDLSFECVININRNFIDEEITIPFNQETNAHTFEI